MRESEGTHHEHLTPRMTLPTCHQVKPDGRYAQRVAQFLFPRLRASPEPGFLFGSTVESKVVKTCPTCKVTKPFDEFQGGDICLRCRREEVEEDPLKKALTFEGEVRQDLPDDVLDEYGC